LIQFGLSPNLVSPGIVILAERNNASKVVTLRKEVFMTAKSGKDSKKTGASISNKPGVGTGSTATKGKSQNSSRRDATSQNDHGKSDRNANIPRNVKAENDDSVMRPMDRSNTERRTSSAEERGSRND
jgi:hypothetical protein